MQSVLLMLTVLVLHEHASSEKFLPSDIYRRKSPLPSNVLLLNSGRSPNFPGPVKVQTAKPGAAGYTFFPLVYSEGSPKNYFYPLENSAKTRVKKVLFDYGVRRGKRAAVEENDVKVKRKSNRQLRSRATAAVPEAGAGGSRDRKKSIRKGDATRVRSAGRYPRKSRGPRKLKSQLRLKSHRRPKPARKKKRSRPRDDNVRKRSHKKTQKSGGAPVHLESRRLVSGRDAKIEDYPYVVSIQKKRMHWCAGALLNRQLIISTANCFWKTNNIVKMRIRAGSRYIERGGQTANIQKVIKHPMWSIRSSPDNDLALALLDRNLHFSHSLHAVDLPNAAMMPPFEDAWVTSWGAVGNDGVYDSSLPPPLQVYHARLLDRRQCQNSTMRYGVAVSNNFICLSQGGKQAPCTRDTGAPAVSGGVLWGLASWGIRKFCGSERFPAMFSYTASPSNLDFITNATRVLMAETRIYPYMDRYSRRNNLENNFDVNDHVIKAN